jgi:hypothetical protein
MDSGTMVMLLVYPQGPSAFPLSPISCCHVPIPGVFVKCLFCAGQDMYPMLTVAITCRFSWTFLIIGIFILLFKGDI